jgi:mannosyl-3-phosphoglycerate phosphatase
MDVIVTDLDGTLLDHDTYTFAGAAGALSAIRDTGTRLVLCSSKTRAEMECWREWLGVRDPYIVENGGAVVWDPGCFPGDDTAIELGTAYPELRRVLAEAAGASRATVRGFGDMTVPEVAELCSIPEFEARLAKDRQWDEPFVLVAGDPDRLAAEIASRGLHTTRGGRFFHILGNNDKGEAVRRLISKFTESGENVETLGLGDGLNDASFLKQVDAAVLIPSPQLAALRKRVPRAAVAHAGGSSGWNRAVIAWIGRHGGFRERRESGARLPPKTTGGTPRSKPGARSKKPG